MSADEARRRNIHNILSSKSLLEAIEKLTINKETISTRNVNKSLGEMQRKTKVNRKNDIFNNFYNLFFLKLESEVVFNVQSSNNSVYRMVSNLMITQDGTNLNFF
jgi:hypothetical protein